ncbi:hypothetical protein [Achromobacter deleyi]|uniref:hypothetical protein n=1 Tax=Achromobacter deleyi TaxID=1353891 RepID=UPI001490C889|nr:hypothetical protein [Achromobacter deleyi]QVQ26160.1 hypothetical protein HLG70_25465 [Achromobacter deleyi]UIP21722.1 hypothetical protein LYZ39_04140 [Achromobacter deleyi]
MSTFSVQDAPDELTIVQHLKAHTPFAEASAALNDKTSSQLLAIPLPPALYQGLQDAAHQAIEAHGLHGWLSAEGRHHDHNYQSLSLVYNPDMHEPGVENVHQSTLGTSLNPINEFFYNSVQRHRGLKNTYFDSYGFRVRTPAARLGELGKFLDQCGLTLIRSRLSVLIGERGITEDFMDGWHRDEPVFENLRLNIPLTSDPAYRLQIEHEKDTPQPDSDTMTEHFLAPGYAYTFNTNVAHRVYVKEPSSTPRIHLVLGFSPWFDHDAVQDHWQANPHFGATHPFDLLRGGKLHPALKAQA